MVREIVMAESSASNQSRSSAPGDAKGETATGGGRTHTGMLSGLLIVLVALAFGGAFQNGFVNFDDDLYVTGNPEVRGGLTWEGVKWAFHWSEATANWHPLTWISHMADCTVYGLAPWGHHLTSVLLHAANTVLLFLVLRAATGATWRSFAVAAIFGLHPLRVESVAWVAERKDLLSTFFGLLVLAAYGRYAQIKNGKLKIQNEGTKLKSGSEALWYYGAALVFYAMSLMSKPMLVTMPFLMLVLDFWPLRRSAVWGRRGPAGWRTLVVEKVPFFALAVASCTVTFLVQRASGAMKGVSALPTGWRLENAAVSYGRYLGKIFAPVNLAVFYPRVPAWPAGAVLAAVVMLLGITGVVVWMRTSRPWLAAGWFWYLGALVPVIGLVQVGEQAMADRYLYLPAAGIFIMAVWAAEELTRRWQRRAAVCAVGVAVVLMVCLTLTWRQVGFWRNSRTLFERDIAVAGDNYLAECHLADFESHHGSAERAEAMYRRALELAPGCIQAYDGLGSLLLGEGRIADAAVEFREALKRDPSHVVAHGNLGVALYQQGLTNDSVAELREAIRLAPGYADAHYNLATILEAGGQLEGAITEYEAAARAQPLDAGVRRGLGAALAAAGRREEAIGELKAALALKPGDAATEEQLRALEQAAPR
jgi:Tfp pilus assembly protein PilF